VLLRLWRRPRSVGLRAAESSAAIAVALLLAGCAVRPLVAPATTDVRPDAPVARTPAGSVTVDADRLERFGTEPRVVFSGNVVMKQGRSTQYANRVEVSLDDNGDRILKVVATGCVRIVTRSGTVVADRSVYHAVRNRLVLTGNVELRHGGKVVRLDCLVMDLARHTTWECQSDHEPQHPLLTGDGGSPAAGHASAGTGLHDL
jgi:lipopolysaccharide export system protein LptA